MEVGFSRALETYALTPPPPPPPPPPPLDEKLLLPDWIPWPSLEASLYSPFPQPLSTMEVLLVGILGLATCGRLPIADLGRRAVGIGLQEALPMVPASLKGT